MFKIFGNFVLRRSAQIHTCDTKGILCLLNYLDQDLMLNHLVEI